MSESSEDEFDENFGEHGENSGDSGGNFGELDDETVPGLGAVLSDLLENGNTKKKLHFLRLHHIFQLASRSATSFVLLALTKSSQERRKRLEGHVSSMRNKIVRLTH